MINHEQSSSGSPGLFSIDCTSDMPSNFEDEERVIVFLFICDYFFPESMKPFIIEFIWSLYICQKAKSKKSSLYGLVIWYHLVKVLLILFYYSDVIFTITDAYGSNTDVIKGFHNHSESTR